MDLFSPKHLLIFIILFFFVLWPWARILRKMGFSGWMCFLFIIPPLVNIAFLYYLGFGRWPRDNYNSAATQ